MKPYILLLSLVLCNSGVYASTIANPPSDLQKGLAIYMNFDTTKGIFDSYLPSGGGISFPEWGKGNNPTLGGNGAFGSSGFNPSGSNPGTYGFGSANISTQNFTVSFQFKDWAMAQNSFALKMTTTANETLKFQSYDDNGASNFLFQLFVDGGTGYVGGMPKEKANNISSWQSFTMTSSSSGIKFYLDGELVVNSDKVLKSGFLGFFQLGCNADGTNQANFKTDDFGLWNRTLTEEEIKFIAHNPANTAMPSAAVPEPGTASLALLGMLGFLGFRKRTSK